MLPNSGKPTPVVPPSQRPVSAGGLPGDSTTNAPAPEALLKMTEERERKTLLKIIIDQKDKITKVIGSIIQNMKK